MCRWRFNRLFPNSIDAFRHLHFRSTFHFRRRVNKSLISFFYLPRRRRIFCAKNRHPYLLHYVNLIKKSRYASNAFPYRDPGRFKGAELPCPRVTRRCTLQVHSHILTRCSATLIRRKEVLVALVVFKVLLLQRCDDSLAGQGCVVRLVVYGYLLVNRIGEVE